MPHISETCEHLNRYKIIYLHSISMRMEEMVPAKQMAGRPITPILLMGEAVQDCPHSVSLVFPLCFRGMNAD